MAALSELLKLHSSVCFQNGVMLASLVFLAQ